MNKKLKKLCSVALTIAITASSAISMSVSAVVIDESDYTIVDDKGMINQGNGYKIFFKGHSFYEVEPQYSKLKFVLREDVDYEEANERITEIYNEFYPGNYLDISIDGMSLLEIADYVNNYKPKLYSRTVDGITTYTVSITGQRVSGLDDRKIVEARKYSKAFMEKLNEENLISAFYDFGEAYELNLYGGNKITYPLNVDIDLINNYIDEHNIDCTVKKVDYYYTLEFNDDTDELEQFLIAADIYEATSIDVYRWDILDIYIDKQWYDKNSLEDLVATDPVTTDVTPATTTTSTTETTVSTTETTVAATETSTSATTTAPDKIVVSDPIGDGIINIRDAAFIARKLARKEPLGIAADYNGDGVVNIRDAAAIARDLAKGKLK